MADVYSNMNYSYDAGIAPTLLEQYMQRKALENVGGVAVKPDLQHVSRCTRRREGEGFSAVFVRFQHRRCIPFIEGQIVITRILRRSAAGDLQRHALRRGEGANRDGELRGIDRRRQGPHEAGTAVRVKGYCYIFA